MNSEKENKSEFPLWKKSCRLCSDIGAFFLNSPRIKTEIKFNTSAERESYSSRILQRIHMKVNDFSVLNIHRIGIEVPAQFIYDQLSMWDGHSEYWPNQLARVSRINGSLENILIYTFGIQQIKIPWVKPVRLFIPPLFNMTAIRFQSIPPVSELDGARYLLYKCNGGYPIGIFCLYIRRPISELQEKEKSQLFSLVAFNFYGRKTWFYNNILHTIWKQIHNRASANILNRMKTDFENKFEEQLKIGGVNYNRDNR